MINNNQEYPRRINKAQQESIIIKHNQQEPTNITRLNKTQQYSRTTNNYQEESRIVKNNQQEPSILKKHQTEPTR